MTQETIRRAGQDLAFERKVQLSKWVLAFEQLWPRLWLILGVAALFVAVSLLGLWPMLQPLAHKVVLGLFALALLATLVHAVRIPWPTREAAIRRIERRSGIAHRPASSYEDTLSSGRASPETMAIWDAHRRRLAEMLAKMRVGNPAPRTDRHDPFALRALMLLGVGTLLALVGDHSSDRLRAAFRFPDSVSAANARLDAWVTPPAYTMRPPVMLADGSNPDAKTLASTPIVVPEKSIFIVRSSGAPGARLTLEATLNGGTTSEKFEAAEISGASGISEIRHELKSSSKLRVLSAGSELATWSFFVTPDAPPQITLTRDIERTARGSMKIHFKARDDYGVASAAARFRKLTPLPGDEKTAWARTDALKGPRPPLERPPVLALRLPKANAREVEGSSYLELGPHPWAGLRVSMQLEAKDVAGNAGLSSPLELVLPERRFEKPLARAIIEQRRKLVDDPRYRREVLKALAALALGADVFKVEPKIYLQMRTAEHRLRRDNTRAGRNSVIEQLWYLALKIEDGDLSDAEKRLRDTQDKLSKALEEGASDEEIRQLMQEMRQALNDYMRELMKQAEANGEQPMAGNDPNSQMLSQQDLEQMMKNIEDMARSGARDQAQQMLSELRDLMERMQSGQMSREQQRQNREAMQRMDELGNMVGEQQRLMDDTYGEMREQDRQGQQQRGRQQRGQNRGQGQEPGQQPGERGQQGQQGQQGQGQQGQAGQGQGPQQGRGQGRQGTLGERQGDLRDRMGRLQRDLRDLGLGENEALAGAREAMENAERALRDGDLADAAQEQARALDQMRQGAQQMAQEMMRGMPQRYGQNGESQRDPLGRPQRSEGPDQGTSVKVPDAIDMQRAREILEELRRRSGEVTRPPIELDYLERLLKRF